MLKTLASAPNVGRRKKGVGLYIQVICGVLFFS